MYCRVQQYDTDRIRPEEEEEEDDEVLGEVSEFLDVIEAPPAPQHRALPSTQHRPVLSPDAADELAGYYYGYSGYYHYPNYLHQQDHHNYYCADPTLQQQQQQQERLYLQNYQSSDNADDEMDERESIYLDAVSVSSNRQQQQHQSGSADQRQQQQQEQQHRNSLYLSRQTVYHSAEDVRFGSVDSGGDTRTLTGSATGDSLRTTTDALLQDSRANGGLANLPYVARPKPPSATKAFIGGILKPVLLSTEYNEKTWKYFQDQKRVVDYVLAYNGEEEENPIAHAKRMVYQRNLEQEGLQIETESCQRIHFVKIHVPDQVLSHYCEIMKMQMPMKKLANQDKIIMRDFSIQSTLVKLFRRPMFNFVIIDRSIFAAPEYRLLYEYSRDKPYLFNDREPNFFTPSLRIAVANFILERAYFSNNLDDKKDIGIRRLVEDQVYLDAYPLHDGCTDVKSSCQRALLLQEWASVRKWIKHQPLDHIKEYFGVKIAMYFAWLGFYTHMLIPASVVGLICFFYGLLTYRENRISQEICNDNNTIMCPQCDEYCDYWYLNSTCTISKLAHIFDNEMTIVFSIFMSIWATLYLEMWKRYSSKIQHRWGITEYCSLAEPPRPQYLARLKNIKKTMFNIATGAQEPSPPFWTKKFPSFVYSYSVIFLFILLTIAAVFGIVVYRMSLMTSRNIYGDHGSVSGKLIIFPATTAVINLLVSTILTYAYHYVAVYMTNVEYRRTQTEYNESLNLKIYLFEFVNYYSSIFYIAFVKGKFPGYPAKYNRILHLRQEECSPGGCLMELCIQLAIIMVGKQAIGAVTEIVIPWAIQKFKEFRSVLGIEAEGSDSDERLICCNQWTKDFNLINWNDRSLFNEYLKMVIQYGFITIFVVAFPLGPFFALLNNVVETRLDAKKFLLYYKRAVPQRVRDLGIWYNIMHVVGKVAVISSAFIIAFSSNFIPRLMYMHVVNPDRTDEGFVNHTLAYFNVANFEDHVAPLNSQYTNVTTCRYSEYRNPPDHESPYKRPSIYWHILAIRLAFVVIYQNLVSFVQIVVAWAIPDVPGRLQDQIKREQYLTNEYIIEQEKLKMQRGAAGGGGGDSATAYAQNGYLPSEEDSSLPPEEKLNHQRRGHDADGYLHQPLEDDFDSFQECGIVTSRV
ncbi:anoctamin-5-like isoform X2 [Anopheles darlingi]|uniref:anoctamin-5-like isoform X2 n=1 Tax=Anopheles darlingi TaxID=43151 RepID=UPI0021000CF3|nr:anoctamin-5-like isoform X2 [Anopheles darlingi]